MRNFVTLAGGALAACLIFVAGTFAGGRAQSAAPTALGEIMRVLVSNGPAQAVPVKLASLPAVSVSSLPAQPEAYFPAQDQTTGVWQGCGPAGNQGLLGDFNTGHARVRIVQVFIDASINCPGAGAHAYVIVYQAAPAPTIRRSIRKPMTR